MIGWITFSDDRIPIGAVRKIDFCKNVPATGQCLVGIDRRAKKDPVSLRCASARCAMYSIRGPFEREQVSVVYDRVFPAPLALLKEHASKSQADAALIVFFSARLITDFDLVSIWS